MTFFNHLTAKFKRSQFSYVIMLVLYLLFCLLNEAARKESVKLFLIIVSVAFVTLLIRTMGSYKRNQ